MVRDGGTPVPGATVRVRTLPLGQCDFSRFPSLFSDTVTRADGTFAHTSYEGFGDTTCVRVTAYRYSPSADSSSVDTRVRYTSELDPLADSVLIQLFLPGP